MHSTTVFALSALLGPLVRFLTWPSQNPEMAARDSTSTFVYNLVVLIWPTQPLAVMEATIGTFAAVVLSVVANIALFAIVGLAVGIIAERWFLLLASYVFVCGLALALALWGAGFNIAYLESLAIAVALTIYAIPFWLVYRTAG